MKYHIFLFAILFSACNNGNDTTSITQAQQDTMTVQPTKIAEQAVADTMATAKAGQVYANERFKDVTVQKTGEHQFLIKGKGQIFEASFSWVVEDGHQELKKGHEMTDAGAPEWGNFEFTVEVEKARENSTLMLILFESSPKDGSRQYELPLKLY